MPDLEREISGISIGSGLTLYRYMDVGIPPSTIVLPRVQPPWLPKFPKRAYSGPYRQIVCHIWDIWYSDKHCLSLRTLVRSGDNDPS